VKQTGKPTPEQSRHNKTQIIMKKNVFRILAATAAMAMAMTACDLDDSVTLISISAAYTQGSTVVTPSTPLDDLKAGLTVTANYSDGSNSAVSASDYALSGT